MKTFKISFLVFAVFAAMTFISCGGEKAAGNEDDNNTDSTETTSDADAHSEETDNTADASDNADLGKLSEETRAAMADAMKGECKCLTENKDEVKKMVDALQPLLEKIEGGEEVTMEDAMGTMMGAGMAAQNYSKCSQGNQPNAEAMKKAEEEMKEMYADLEEGERNAKQMELALAVMKAECPEGAELFEPIAKFGAKMQELQAQK